MKGTFLLWMAGTVCAVGGLAWGGYAEDWNDPVAQSNDWWYYVAGEPNDGNVDMTWNTTGGVADSGYVSSPLPLLTQWDEMPGVTDYWPGYTMDANHPIDLTSDPVIRISLKDVTPPTGPAPGGLDLAGGTLKFWIGEWHAGAGGGDPNKLSFFAFDAPLAWGDDWTDNQIVINDTDWATLVDNQGKSASDLLAGPQQWGFGIFGGTGAPKGVLGFDNFENTVPEPTTAVLLLAGSIAWIRRGRRR